MSHSLDEADRCPVCGQSNRCTLADPKTADRPCWCFTETIDPAVLEALPDTVRNQTCLCPRCAGLAKQASAPHPE